MAFILKERSHINSYNFTLLVCIAFSFMLGFPILHWARSGCFVPSLNNSMPICGTSGVAAAAVFSGVIISIWINYFRPAKVIWESYDPAWLIELAQAELPENVELRDALSNCRKATQIGWKAKILYFVDPFRRNDPSFGWKFKEAIVFETYSKGPVIVDVLQDGRIGAVECSWMVSFAKRRPW